MRTKETVRAKFLTRQQMPGRGPRCFHWIPFPPPLLGLNSGPGPSFPKSATPYATVLGLGLSVPLFVLVVHTNSDTHSRSPQPGLRTAPFQYNRVASPTSPEALKPLPIATRAAEASGNCSFEFPSPNALPGSATSAAIVPRARTLAVAAYLGPSVVNPTGLADAESPEGGRTNLTRTCLV